MSNYFDEIFDNFINGELEVEKFFNDYETFFKILDRKGLLTDLDLNNINNQEEWQNRFLLYLYQNNHIELFNRWINKFMSDVETDGSGNYYLIIDRLSELSDLFCDSYRSRDGLSQETIAKTLDGENDTWDWFSETTDDIYRDVISELDKENLNYLKEYIVTELKDKEISPETDEMELIASEQGNDEFLYINNENISRILDDEESINYLLDNYLDDLNSNLYSIHHSAYSNAYEDEIYEDIWNELGTYFYGKPEYLQVPHSYKNDVLVQKVKLHINNFLSTIVDILDSNKDYGNSGTIEYNGNFLGYLKENGDCLKVYSPDYPSSNKVEENINSYFKDYL